MNFAGHHEAGVCRSERVVMVTMSSVAHGFEVQSHPQQKKTKNWPLEENAEDNQVAFEKVRV